MRTVLAALVGLAGLPILLLVLAARLPFAVISWVVARLTRWLQPDALPWQQLIEFEAQVGWKPRPHLAAHALDFNGDAYRVETDAEGWRGRGNVASADVVIFGDSFAFGCGIDERAYFANLPGPLRTKAIGAPGYNMVQSFQWMERLADRLAGKTVVWLIYPANDLEDNIRPQMQGYRMPFVRESAGGSWEIVTHHVVPEPWPFPARRTNRETFVDICGGGFIADRVFSASEFLLRRAADLCRSRGAQFVIMTVPDLSPMNVKLMRTTIERSSKTARFDPDAPDRRLSETARSLGIAFVALKDHLEQADYLRNDIHWNARGHRRVADVLARLTVPMRPVVVSTGARHRAASAVRPARQQPTVA